MHTAPGFSMVIRQLVAFVLYVVSCFVYVCCVISVSSYYFCFVYICMYVQGSTENQFTEWIPCRNITITITISRLLPEDAKEFVCPSCVHSVSSHFTNNCPPPSLIKSSPIPKQNLTCFT